MKTGVLKKRRSRIWTFFNSVSMKELQHFYVGSKAPQHKEFRSFKLVLHIVVSFVL